jgi:hypothetical protein
MKQVFLAGCALAAMLAATPAQAERTPSAQIRCDGLPDNVTAGETAARLLGAVTLLGLFAPAHETPDASQRLTGAEGVAICAEALQRESNDIRRAQLILASAIHQVEAGNYDAAITEARRVETDRPALAATAPFRRSLRLGAMEIEALALLGAGRVEDARTKAFELASAAPYDLTASARAWRYIQLTKDFGPREQAFYDNLIRLFPAALFERAMARQLAGDFRAAAADCDLWIELERTVDSDQVGMSIRAHGAITHALAGNAARAEALAEEARTALRNRPDSTAAATTTELLDLYNIWKVAHDGRAAEARLLFANRTSWLRPSPGAVAEVARLLQQGAPADSLTGALAGSPERFRTELLERRRRDLLDDKNRFTAIPAFQSQGAYDRFAANVWRADRSRYFQREDNARVRARFLSVSRDGWGAPAGYAVLLHAALVAQAEGKGSFMLMPARNSLAASFVRIGNAGDAYMIAPLTFETARVIADLSPVIPRPARR